MFNLNLFVMIKKHLLGGTLLVAVLVLLSGCKEIMSNLSNPVNPYLELSENSIKIIRGQSYQIKYSTISDAKPIFTSADEKIATVDANGIVRGANKGTTKITVKIPATECYNGASLEFLVEVDALLSLPAEEAEIGLGAGLPYHIGVTTESNGLITYESSNPNVATVDNNGNVTPVACGDAIIYISIAATPEFDRTETAVFNAKVRVLNETDLNTIINTAAAGDGKVQVMLKDGFELENDLNLEGKKIELDLMNSILTFKGNHSIIISHKFTLKNAKFDLTNSSSQLIQLSQNETVRGTLKKSTEVYTSANQTDYCLIDGITLEKVWVKNLKSDLISDRNTKWAPENVTITNCIVQANYTGSSSSVLWFNSSSVHNMNVDGNIFYNIYSDKTKGTQRFISCMNSSNAVKVYGTTKNWNTDPTGVHIDWKFNNNICINVGYNKFGNNVINSANSITMEGKDNIFYNVKQIYQFFTANAVKTTTGNKIWCPDIDLNTTDTSRTDKDGHPLSVNEDPGITVPTEPLDLVNGVKVK